MYILPKTNKIFNCTRKLKVGISILPNVQTTRITSLLPLNNYFSSLKNHNNNGNDNDEGFYNWQKIESCTQAIKDQYTLNDIMQGYTYIMDHHSEYSEEQINFVMYVWMLYPECEEKVFEKLVPIIQTKQQVEGFEERKAQYLVYLKSYCFRHVEKNWERKQCVDALLRRRVSHPGNHVSLERFYDTMCNYCYENMGDLDDMFEIFKNLLYKEMIEKRYKLEPQTIRLAISMYQNFIVFDYEIKNRKFFQSFPQIYKEDEATFHNFIQILPKILTINFISFISFQDLSHLNHKLNQCQHLTNSKKSKQLLRRYSEHLVLTNKVQLINFDQVLDFI